MNTTIGPPEDGYETPPTRNNPTRRNDGENSPTVWRLRWEMNGLEHTTQWTIHYDLVRNLRDDYRESWPGTGVEMERATVQEVGGVEELVFGHE